MQIQKIKVKDIKREMDGINPYKHQDKKPTNSQIKGLQSPIIIIIV